MGRIWYLDASGIQLKKKGVYDEGLLAAEADLHSPERSLEVPRRGEKEVRRSTIRNIK